MITDASETSVLAANGRYMPAPAPYLLVYHMNPPKSSLSTGSDLSLSTGSDLGLSTGSDPVIVDGRRGLIYNTFRQRIVACGQKTARPMRTGTDMKQRNSKQDKNPIKRSHGIAFRLIRGLSFIYTRLFLGYRCRDKYKIKKGERVLVLSNHQTDADPFCILPAFNKPVYPVATDNIFAGKFRSKLFSALGVIPKKKGVVDLRSTLKIANVLKHGGSALLFIEGNRYYAEFQYFISPSIAPFIKKTGATLVLFNMRGGSGVSPRFKRSNRRGPFSGAIRRVITPEEYAEMDNDTLLKEIIDNLRVYDSDSGNTYKSRHRAEYLERALFACPVCGGLETLSSQKQFINCSRCGLKVEYGEDLHLHSDDPRFKFDRMIDWWNYQKQTIREMPVEPGRVIFQDDNAKLFYSEPFRARVLLAKGRVFIDDRRIVCGDKEFPLDKISSASVVSGRNLTFVCDGTDYTIRGGKRFNPLKYIFLLNRLDTPMREKAADKYFNLEV